jgi:hypothetical protein
MVEITLIGVGVIVLACFILVIFTGINLILALSSSMVLTKVYELVREFEERFQLDEQARRHARGLMDIDTPQTPYNMRG